VEKKTNRNRLAYKPMAMSQVLFGSELFARYQFTELSDSGNQFTRIFGRRFPWSAFGWIEPQSITP
jgi:hypothetical protein